MRSNFPVSSQEINDRCQLMQEYLVEILGYAREGYTRYSGFYEKIEASGNAMITSGSGLPNISDSDSYSFGFFNRNNNMSYQTDISYKIPVGWGA